MKSSKHSLFRLKLIATHSTKSYETFLSGPTNVSFRATRLWIPRRLTVLITRGMDHANPFSMGYWLWAYYHHLKIARHCQKSSGNLDQKQSQLWRHILSHYQPLDMQLTDISDDWGDKSSCRFVLGVAIVIGPRWASRCRPLFSADFYSWPKNNPTCHRKHYFNISLQQIIGSEYEVLVTK